MCLKMLPGEGVTCGHRIIQTLKRMTRFNNLQGMPTPSTVRRHFLSNETMSFWVETSVRTITPGIVSREEVRPSYP